MIIIGMTGPIGHGKSTFAKAIKQREPATAHFESSLIIAEVANGLHGSTSSVPSRDDIASINNWLRPLPAILLEIVHQKCSFEQIELELDEIERHPVEYEKLLLHLENLSRDLKLVRQPITKENKEAYRPILQWLGGYLVKKVDSGIWYKEIIRRIYEAGSHGTKICVIGGLRFPSDAAILRSAGGILIKVYRPGHLQYDMMDPTERERDNIIPDATITSDGTVENMERCANQVLDDIQNGTLKHNYRTHEFKN